MKVFVTGVGGQLGHDVVNELIGRGHEVPSRVLRKFLSGRLMVSSNGRLTT